MKLHRLQTSVILVSATYRQRWVWSIGGMILAGDKEILGENVPMPLCQQHCPHGLAYIKPWPP